MFLRNGLGYCGLIYGFICASVHVLRQALIFFFIVYYFYCFNSWMVEGVVAPLSGLLSAAFSSNSSPLMGHAALSPHGGVRCISVLLTISVFL